MLIFIQAYIDQPPQPTVSANQTTTVEQHPLLSTHQLPPVQITYHAPLHHNSQYTACDNCPSVWRYHLESIMFSDPENKGISNLKRSYRYLQHVDSAHLWHYGAACPSCENYFCYHLEKMMLLEAAKGDLSEVKIDLQSSCTVLRGHIKEAHGGC